jgi:hypothetical protein
MTQITVKRECPGLYEVSANGLKVIVRQYEKSLGDSYNGWVARAGWGVTDPLNTKREAIAEAKLMLQDRMGE